MSRVKEPIRLLHTFVVIYQGKKDRLGWLAFGAVYQGKKDRLGWLAFGTVYQRK